MGKIGVFGGSFNPPHLGHMLAARELKESLGLFRVILVPAAAPPHKKLPAGSPDAATRLELLRAASASLPGAEVSDIELRREGPSYTADTLRALSAVYPGEQLVLLMGTDMFLTLDTWYRPEEICRFAAIATAHREADNAALHARIAEQAEKLRSQFGAEVFVADNRFLDVSSTTVRRMLRFECAESYLDPAVLAVIREKGLYGVGESLKGLPFVELRRVSLALLKEKRVAHVIGCCETAVKLARRWGANEEDAARAGILHDVTKALDYNAQLLLCGKYGIIIDDFERKNWKLLHSRTGAAVARHIFGENDAVCDAIYWHTTGRANMTLLEKILYIADYMEPNRDFPGVEKLRALTEIDLDAAMLCGFQMSIDLLESEGKALGTDTVQARDFLLKERNQA